MVNSEPTTSQATEVMRLRLPADQLPQLRQHAAQFGVSMPRLVRMIVNHSLRDARRRGRLVLDDGAE